MYKSVGTEVIRLIPGFICLVLVGLVVGGLPWWLLAGAMAYAIVNLRRLANLSAALSNNDLKTIEQMDEGIWANATAAILRREKQLSLRRERLSQMLDQYRNATQALPDGVIVVGESDDIVAFNSKAEHLLGLKSPTDIGRPLNNYLRRPEFTAFLERSDPDSRLEIDSPARSDIKLHVQIVRFQRGRQRLMIVRDVTRLERLERVRRDFVANVSHELKSPLTVIQGYNENLQRLLLDSTDRASMDDTLRPIVEKSIAEVDANASRMALLIEDLLELSRLEAGEADVDNVLVDVGQLLERICTEAEGLSRGKHALVLAADSGLRLRGNEKELYSAFSNIVFNAVRYSDAPGEVRIEWREDEEGTGVVAVTDEGRGIPAKDVHRVTERFYRVDQGRSRDLGGTGLGLAIAKHVMMRHDAEILIDSEIDSGTTVRCVFAPARVERSSAKVIDYTNDTTPHETQSASAQS